MEELDVKHQFHLLQKEVEAAVSVTGEVKLDLLAAIDSLKIEVKVGATSLKPFTLTTGKS